MALTVAHTTTTAQANNPAYDISATAWNGTGAHTIAGTATIAQGGTNASSFTSNAIDYFDGTSIASMAGTSWDNTNRSLTLTGATVTTSKPILDLSQTWNAGAVTFTALKLNVTNTTSAAGSLLLDLQLGGNSKAAINKDGRIQANPANAAPFGSASDPDFTIAGRASGMYSSGATAIDFTANTVRVFGGDSSGFFFITDTNLRLFQDAAGILAQRNSTNAQTFRVYNTYTDSSNYERGVFDWTTTANTLTIGTQAGGTGTNRDVQIVRGGTLNITLDGTSVLFSKPIKDASGFWGTMSGGTNGYWVSTGSRISLFGDNGGVGIQSISGATAIGIKVGLTSGGADGWIQWGGQTRVAADAATATTAFAVATGLTVNVAAGRTYSFEANLQMTDAAAGGVKAKIGGTCTATAIQYTGWAVADNAIKAKTNATALDTTVASTVTTETSGIVIQIYGTITVNVAGTLNVQYAQNTTNAVATTVKRGSYFIVHDMP